MLKRFYYRVLIMLLASTEEHLMSLASTIKKIEKRTDVLERSMEEEAVHLANLSKDRREALAAVEASYDRKETFSQEVIGVVRSEIEKAEAARAAVKKFLETL